jgi:ATP-binding cassette subfamily C protein/ATP-binding cassette subfamily C protein EexD
MGMLPAIVRRWHSASAETDSALSRATGRGAVFTATSKMLRLALQIAVLGIGAYLAIHNELSPGAIIAASILTTRALAPVEQAIGGWRQAMSARTSYQRLGQQLRSLSPSIGGMQLPRPKGRLSAEGASFAFPGVKEPTLRDISFAIEPGRSLAIIGPSAAGKTTLSRMLVGSLVPSRGHVRLDGADITQLNSDDRGRYVGYLPQDIELFDGTVRENIARMSDGDAESVTEAAIASGVHELILRLPKGYETEIGPGGAALSGGQRQRIGLARAFYGNPSLIVLDEPNANLDQPGEAALVEAIKRARERGTTMVLVTHSAAMIRLADKILVLDEGRIRQFGSREELLAKIAAVPQQAPPQPARKEA